MPDPRPTRTDRAVIGALQLPLHHAVWAGVVAYALLVVLATATAVNGTSSGALFAPFFSGEDPRLVAGQPRPIRSDEWLVATPLVVSQAELGFPRVSGMVPGGMDMSVVWDVPYREWSVLFRPHLWAFFVLPLDHAFAYKWWLPAAVLGAAAYALLVTLWRRPLAALAGSFAFLLSGFVQWWYLPITLWPLAFALVVATSAVWMLRTTSGRVRLLLALLCAYAGTVAVVVLYPAFLVPCVLVTAAFCVGAALAAPLPTAERWRRVAPLAVAGALAGTAVGAYLLTRTATIEAVVSTLYPGLRRGSTGAADEFPGPWVWGGVFGQGLSAADLTGFAPNSSEGSSFLLVGLFLVPSALWLVARRWRTGRRVDWLLVSLLGCTLLLLVYLYVPGWDALARVLLLDRTTAQRSVIGLGLVSFLLLAVTVGRVVETGQRPPAWVALGGGLLVVGSHGLVLRHLQRHAMPVLDASPSWPLLVTGLVVAVVGLGRGARTVPSVVLLVVAFAVAGTVNPLYRGVLDLRESDLGLALDRVEAADPGTWLLVGDYRPAAVLRELGVESFSGVQAAPSDEMWEAIDDDGSHEHLWNRYAHVWWAVGLPEEMVSPSPDQVTVGFDSCDDFTQTHVDYVLAQGTIDQPCLRPLETVLEESGPYTVYRVSPAG